MSLLNFASWGRLQGSKDDDWADRVSHLYTVVLLALFTILVSSAQYVGDPIQCWCPAQFTGAYVAYTKNICWISNTYYVPLNNNVPDRIEDRESKQLTYYQWVPIIFLFQALLFKIPNLIWRIMNGASGLNVDRLVTLAESTQMGRPEDREKTIWQVARFLDRWLKAQRQYHFNLLVRMRQKLSNVFCFWMAKREGRYLTGLYLFIKLLYVVNVISQFFLLNAFLAMDFNVYGFEVINMLMTNGELDDTPRFPRVTLCDFEIRQLQNLQRYTVQCVLPINLFNEKIFVFLWFWMFIVATISVGSYISWMYYILIGVNRYRYAKKYLNINNHLQNKMDGKLARKFADEYLRDDGIFVLRVVGKNSSELVLGDLVNDLWKLYKENPIPSQKELYATRKNSKLLNKMNGNLKNVKPTTDMDQEDLRGLGQV